MWTSFPADGEWTRDPSWQEYLGAALDREEAELGLEDLRRALPPARVQAFEDPSQNRIAQPLGVADLFLAKPNRRERPTSKLILIGNRPG